VDALNRTTVGPLLTAQAVNDHTDIEDFMSYSTPKAALMAAAILFTAGCSDDPTGPSDSLNSQIRADVATAIGDAIAEDVSAISTSSAGTSLYAFGGDFDVSGCTSVLGVFTCDNVFGALNGGSSLTFRDQGSVTQDAYDPATTSSVLIETNATGDVTRGAWSGDFVSERQFTITGLSGSETSRTWSGTGDLTWNSSLHSAAREYRIETSSTLQNVMVPATGTTRWPTSGTLSSQVDIEVLQGDNEGDEYSTTATVTFNGTSQVPMNIGGVSYMLDLTTRSVSTN
jgi:hypothetical protein